MKLSPLRLNTAPLLSRAHSHGSKHNRFVIDESAVRRPAFLTAALHEGGKHYVFNDAAWYF